MPEPDPTRVLQGRYARTARRDVAPAEHEAASRDYHAAKLEKHIRDTLAAAPPLTADQRDRLASLLRPGVAWS